MITFDDLKRNYEVARECMTANFDATQNPNYPSHAVWIVHSTMVRWLYGSSRELFKNFEEEALSFKGDSNQNDLVAEWRHEVMLCMVRQGIVYNKYKIKEKAK